MVTTEIRFFALKRKKEQVRGWIEVRTFFSCEDNNNISVQYSNGGLLPDIVLLTQCYYYHRGTRLNVKMLRWDHRLQIRKKPFQTVSYEEIFPGNFGVGGVKNFSGKKTFLTRKFSGKISSPKISSGNFGPDSPSRGNFEAQNFLETTGNFTRKFRDHFIIELKSVPFPSTG